jgi:hypothetical protein
MKAPNNNRLDQAVSPLNSSARANLKPQHEPQ